MLGGNGTLATPVVGGCIQDLSRGSMILLNSAQIDLKGGTDKCAEDVGCRFRGWYQQQARTHEERVASHHSARIGLYLPMRGGKGTDAVPPWCGFMARLSRGSIVQTPLTGSYFPIRAGNGTLAGTIQNARSCQKAGPTNVDDGVGEAHDAVPDRSLFSEMPLRCCPLRSFFQSVTTRMDFSWCAWTLGSAPHNGCCRFSSAVTCVALIGQLAVEREDNQKAEGQRCSMCTAIINLAGWKCTPAAFAKCCQSLATDPPARRLGVPFGQGPQRCGSAAGQPLNRAPFLHRDGSAARVSLPLLLAGSASAIVAGTPQCLRAVERTFQRHTSPIHCCQLKCR